MRQIRTSLPVLPVLAAGLAAIAAFFAGSPLSGQSASTVSSPFTPPANGPARNESTWIALVNGTVHAAPGQVLPLATVVMRDGVITQVLPAQPGADGAWGTDDDVLPRAPEGATRIECKGEHIYAAFVDAYCEVRAGATGDLNAAGGEGIHANNEVMPQRSALDASRPDDKLSKLRERGFGAVAIAPDDGIFRGRAAVISTAARADEPSAARPRAYAENVYHAVAMEFRDEDRGYPDSLMGAIAVIRQGLSDADWMAATREWVRLRQGPPFNNTPEMAARVAAADPGPVNAMDYLARVEEGNSGVARPSRLLFRADDELDALRALRIAREFSRPAMIVGSGREYRRLPALVEALKPTPSGHDEAQAQTPLILPLNFPKQPDVSSVAAQESTDVRTMMEWEQGPTNPRRCIDAGLSIALTTFRLRDGDDFIGAVRTAIAHGLSPDAAYGALTSEPARFLGLESSLGTIEVGKRANVLVSDEPIFTSAADPRAKAPTLRTLYVDGVRHELNAEPVDFSGTWKLDVATTPSLPPELSLRITKSGEVWVETPAPVENVEPAMEEVEPFPGAHKTVPRPKLISNRATAAQLSKHTIAFQFDPAKLIKVEEGKPRPRAGLVSITAAVSHDSKGSPNAMIGQGVSEEGTRFTFTATKQPTTSPIGVWRLTEVGGGLMDDYPLPADAPRQAFVTLEEKSANIVVMLEPLAEGKDAGLPRFVALHTDDVKWDGDFCSVKLSAESVQKLIDMGFKLRPGAMSFGMRRAEWNPSRATISGDHSPAPGEPIDVASNPAEADLAFTLEAVDHAPTEDSLKKSRAMLRRIHAVPQELPTPFGPYGVVGHEDRPSLVAFTNATVWTQTDRGILENATLIIDSGDIAAILPPGAQIPRDATVIDATGLHITPGIIDCHSHIGISKGVNEGGQAITAEVRIQDVTNPDDINWYRHLASGVTAVNNLHGSANCIGGQSQTNKIRWGCESPGEMHMEGAPPGIKFALGENPTQVNWGLPRRERYPISRMGIAALIRDRFTQAQMYMAARNPANADMPPVRRDLELEAIAEIIAGQRLIHCHAYRQDEMRMLISTMHDFGVRIGTFQHVLEGYKLAEDIRDNTGGGSGFTDWWAYKMEVQDAIPQGLPLMQEVGCVVSFNSDSAEMARRLNVEAAKAIKYSDGRISPQEALAFVTNAPAKQLGVDHRIGSLAPGLNADIAIWNGSPLSAFSRCISTWVDGRELFSDARDAAAREQIRAERARLIRKIQGVGEDDPDDEPAADVTPSGDPAHPEGAPASPGTNPGMIPGKVDGPPTQLAIMRDRHRQMLRRKYLEAYLSGRPTPDQLPGYCGCEE